MKNEEELKKNIAKKIEQHFDDEESEYFENILKKSKQILLTQKKIIEDQSNLIESMKNTSKN